MATLPSLVLFVLMLVPLSHTQTGKSTGTTVKTPASNSEPTTFKGIRDLMPATCREMMDILAVNATRLNPSLPKVEDEFTSLAIYCPFSAVLLNCIIQNIFESRQTPDPLIWASGYLINFRDASDISQKVCLWHQFPPVGSMECLRKTTIGRQRCRERISHNLQYIRDSMNPEMPHFDKVRTICSVHQTLSECVTSELKEQCDEETVDNMGLFYKILGRDHCSNIEKPVIKGKQRNLKEDLVRRTLNDCEFDESLYGLPTEKFSFRRYISSLGKMCEKLDSIVSCIRDKVTRPKTTVGRYLGKSIDLDAMDAYTRTLCMDHDEFRKNVKCLSGLDVNVEYCLNTVKSNSLIDRFYDTNKRKEPMVCSILEDFSNCFAIQASRCSLKVSNALKKSHSDGMHGMCKLGKHTPSHIGGSALLHCGVTMATEVETQVVTLKSNRSLITIIDHLIDFGCSEVNGYMKCIGRYFDKSKSLLDEFMRTVVNFSRKDKITSMLREVCTHAHHIKTKMPCLIQHQKDFQACAGLSLPLVNTNLLALKNMKGKELRAKFCKDLSSMFSCAIKTIATCDPVIGQLANKTVSEVINSEHCGQEQIKKRDLHSNATAPVISTVSVLFGVLIAWLKQ